MKILKSRHDFSSVKLRSIFRENAFTGQVEKQLGTKRDKQRVRCVWCVPLTWVHKVQCVGVKYLAAVSILHDEAESVMCLESIL